MADKKLTMAQKLSFRFVLFFKKGEDYSAVINELNPKTVLVLEEGTFLFLETDKAIIKDEGVVVDKKYTDFVRYIVIVPDPEFGCLNGRSLVEFATFIDKENLQFVPVKHNENELIRDYIVLNPGSFIDEKRFKISFLSVTGSKPTAKTFDISVNLNVREFICETESEENNEIRYLLRCPPDDSPISFDTKKIEKMVQDLFKNQ